MKKYITKYISVLGLVALLSCDGFLDQKPQKSLLVPSTVEDVRALLDNYNFLMLTPLITWMMSDEWNTSDIDFETFPTWQQNAYTWQKEIFDPQERSSDYQTLHSQMFIANTALDLIDQLGDQNSPEIATLKGEALVIRARVLFDLAVLFLPVPQSGLNDQIKIPVNLTGDVNAPLTRIGTAELIGLVKEELEKAFLLLPERSPFKTRPDKRVAKGFLARIHLYEQNWEKALESANYVIQSGDKLLDLSKLNPSSSYPFELFNEETLYYQQMQTSILTIRPSTEIAKDLYSSYLSNDRRRALFFRLNPTQGALFKGSYTGGFQLFTGISLSEMYLTAAEAGIRKGDFTIGLQRLNELGITRYSGFQPWLGMSQEKALELVMGERRKELVFRGLRWMDMKRVKALSSSFMPSRTIKGQVYKLENEEQYILNIPPYETELGGR